MTGRPRPKLRAAYQPSPRLEQAFSNTPSLTGLRGPALRPPFSCFPRPPRGPLPGDCGLGAIKARMVRAWKAKGEINAVNHPTGTKRTHRRRVTGAGHYRSENARTAQRTGHARKYRAHTGRPLTLRPLPLTLKGCSQRRGRPLSRLPLGRTARRNVLAYRCH